MTRTYTAAEEAWLRKNYRKGTINDTVDAFEEAFGRRPSKQALFVKANNMGPHKDKHGEERRHKAQKTMRWSSKEFERERNWMLENDKGESVFGTIDAFEEEFGIRLNRSQVSLFRSTYGTCRRVSHGGGKPAVPVGTERVGKDGYIVVKVRDWPTVPQTKDNWKLKHVAIWEEANGQELPKGMMVLFADRDKRNFDPGNLVAIPRKYIGCLNNPELPSYHDRETLEACITLCKLRSMMMDAEKGRERPCEVCGKKFTPTARQRQYRAPVKTCPDCLRAGKKAKGVRGDRKPMKCAVCGQGFERHRADAQRCPDCVEAKPRWGVEQHSRYYRVNGRR